MATFSRFNGEPERFSRGVGAEAWSHGRPGYRAECRDTDVLRWAPDVGNRETPQAASHGKTMMSGMGGGRIHPWWPTSAVGVRRDMIFVQRGSGTERLFI